MLQNGLGSKVVPCLTRSKSVNKSAQNISGNRPLPGDHYDSFSMSKLDTEVTKVVLIDDVVTRGSTCIGAANRVHTTLPNVKIYTFAAIWTISNASDFKSWFAPANRTIKLRSEWKHNQETIV